MIDSPEHLIVSLESASETHGTIITSKRKIFWSEGRSGSLSMVWHKTGDKEEIELSEVSGDLMDLMDCPNVARQMTAGEETEWEQER